MFLLMSGSQARPTLMPILFLLMLLLIIFNLNYSPTMLIPIELFYIKFLIIFDVFPLMPQATIAPSLWLVRVEFSILRVPSREMTPMVFFV
jgi:hypothetical protein